MKPLKLVNDVNELINNFTDEDVCERYIVALMVIKDLMGISLDEAHIGISDVMDEMENDGKSIEITRGNEPETTTRH